MFMRGGASPVIKLPYTDHIKWYTEGYANGNGWANNLMKYQRDFQGLDAAREVTGNVALVAGIAGQGAAMVIGEQNLCAKRLTDQLKY
jgi:hypothetical protein